MKIIQPLDLFNFYIVSSNLQPENYPTWASGTTYQLDALVFKQIGYVKYIYRSLISNNIGNVPDGSPAAWVLVGSSNDTALWDDKIETTSVEETIIISLSNEVEFDSIAFLSLGGVSIHVAMVYQGNTVYDQTFAIDNPKYGYYWGDYGNADQYSQGNLVFANIPAFVRSGPSVHDCVTTITITGDYNSTTGTGWPASIGMVVFGKALDLGGTDRGVKLGILDYSVKDVDQFGNHTIIKRKYSTRMTANLEIPTDDVDRVFNVLSAYRSTPLVWVGNDNTHTSMIVWGFYKDFEIDVAYPSASYCSLSVEGL